MTRFHLKYRAMDYPEWIIEATQNLFEAKPWRLDIGQLDLYQRWADIVTEVYNVKPVGIHKIDVDEVGFNYGANDNVANIVIGRYSLATLFVAMGAHILSETGGASSPEANLEWGYSLFYIVKPVMFRRRVREGRILHMTARDTFSRATWERLQVLGWTDGDRLIDPQFDIRTLDSDDDLTNPDEEDEADEANEDFVPVEQENGTVYNFPIRDPFVALRNLTIAELRRKSRGVFSGGYNMPKEQLVRELYAHGVTS